MSIRINDRTTIVASSAMPPPAVLPGLDFLTTADVIPALQTMLTLMDALDERIRLVVERDGTVIAAGAGVARGVAQSASLVLVEGRLDAITQAGRRQLSALLKAGDGQIVTELMDRHNREGHCILRAVGLCGRAIALTMQMAHDGFEARLADLEQAFGLTPSEALIAERLHQGHGPQDIGETLGISVHTVRAHLRHCYEKLGVSSREGLSRKLAPYRLN